MTDRSSRSINSVAVLVCCHNRREKTLACLTALFANRLLRGLTLSVILVDDGSTDGTEVAIRDRFPMVEIVNGDGNLYWNRAMHRAFARAMEIGFDGYLWLNDDTVLYPEAFNLLFSALDLAAGDAIVVGAIADPVSGQATYGGARYVSPCFRPFLATVVHPGSQPQDVDVMNGNLVLIPDCIARKLGNLDPMFEHGMGDTDYSMRARKQGIRILLTAGYAGTCPRNSLMGTHRDKALPLLQRVRHIFTRNGLPWRSWLKMCWRHGGLLWPVHFVWAYAKVIFGR
jgi:GT2 family glycosyltransferase